MNSHRLPFILPVVWIVSGIVAYSGMCGHLDYYCQNEWVHTCNQNAAREHMGFSAMVGIAGPVGFVASFMVTGFYQNGMRFNVRPYHA